MICWGGMGRWCFRVGVVCVRGVWGLMAQNLGDPVLYRAAVDGLLGVVRGSVEGRLAVVQARQVCDQILSHYQPLFSVPQIAVMVYRALLDQGIGVEMAVAVTFELFEP